LAAVLILVAAGLAGPARAQENLDAGKSPSQLFAGTCSACHKSPRGLLKTVAPGSLQGFLRQHYTTGPEMAGVLSSYLVANGAGDTRYMGGQGKGKDGKPDASSAPSGQPERSGRRHRRSAAEPAEAGQAEPKPDAAGTDAGARPRAGRHGRRAAHPSSAAESRPDGDAQAPAQADDGRHHGRKSGKRKHGKPVADEVSKPDGMREAPSDAGRVETTPSPDQKPATAARVSEPPQIEPPKESEPATLRADPAPSAAPASSPTTTQSIPATSSAGGGSDPSIPTAPAH
jgi:hypothetical protein